MQIEGPLRFSVAQDEQGNGYELFLDFQEDFRALSLPQQDQAFRDYLVDLGNQLAEMAMDARNRQGMLIAQQIAEQLQPHISSGDLALSETINIHIRAGSPEVSLIDLLRQ
jgi:hypothetical protein